MTRCQDVDYAPRNPAYPNVGLPCGNDAVYNARFRIRGTFGNVPLTAQFCRRHTLRSLMYRDPESACYRMFGTGPLAVLPHPQETP